MQIYSDKIFKNPVKVIRTAGKKEVNEAVIKLDELRKKYYLTGFISYDFDKLYFECFEGYEKYEPASSKKLGTILKPLISKEDYIENFGKIKNYIENGITYEVNYTYPFEILSNLEGIELFEALLEKQKTQYSAYLNSDKYEILSFSPELFFRFENGKITTKPMKGTISRGKTEKEDNENRKFLTNDIKNRAENVMIVDLLRNDLSKIAKTGTVKADKLFETEKHKTVFQMTSEISCELKKEIGLYEIFKALFPCGSITGAPKKSTMEVIKEIEPYNRNFYCGAIGFLWPSGFEFSVPIRIIQKIEGKYYFHTGGAVVWDSIEEEEFEETLVKSKFLETDFSIIETMVDEPKLHFERMKNSARFFDFKWNEDIEKIKPAPNLITRILLNKDGNFSVEYRELNPPSTNKIKIKGKVNSNNPFLYHKTTIRENFPKDVFDEIRTNEKGEITEGVFTNIVIQKEGKMYTPPVECGLLNGIERQKLLCEGKIFEKVLYPEDLKNADKIFCLNSVRKLKEVELCL